MGSSRRRNVEAYFDSLAPERRKALETLRSIVFRVAPNAVESIRHGMPAYDVGGHELCLFASQKHYVSLYLDPKVVEAYRGPLDGLSIGKSCVRFRRLDQMPLGTVERMLSEIVRREEAVDGEAEDGR